MTGYTSRAQVSFLAHLCPFLYHPYPDIVITAVVWVVQYGGGSLTSQLDPLIVVAQVLMRTQGK
jgi:hypothetical protein